jgi:hypothetical protein
MVSNDTLPVKTFLGRSPARGAVWIEEEVPGFAVLGVGVSARPFLGAKAYGVTMSYFVDRKNVPSLFRDNVGGDEIDFRVFVTLGFVPGATVGADLIQPVVDEAAGFHLNTQEVASALYYEVKTINVAPGSRHHQAEAGGFVQKGGFPELAALISSDSKLISSFSGRAPLGRWDASARSALGFAHGLKWKSPAKEKGASGEACAKLDLYI